mgnify:CR=1 FL=1
MPVTPGGATGVPPIQILVGPPGNGTAQNVTNLIDLSTIEIEETGNQEGATFDAVLFDRSQLFSSMRGEWRLRAEWRNPTNGTWQPLFRGFIREPSPEIIAIYGENAIHAEDTGTLLDSAVIQTMGVTRAAGESDKARIQWLLGELVGRDGVRVAQPLLAEMASGGTVDWSKVQVLNASMPRQTFPARLSLRQALERILSQASDTADYYLDHEPRLWTFDADTMNSVLDIAPYTIRVGSPGAGEVAPENLVVAWDSSNLWNGYFVRGANARVSKTYLDSDPFPALSAPLPGPYSVQLFGRRIGMLSAPDADTDAKVQRVAKAALRDTRNPIPRVTFSLSESSCYDASGKRWRGGQRVFIHSAIHGLNGSGTDAGPWAGSGGSAGYLLQPFRIKRVTTRFAAGTGTMRVDVEAGGRRKVLYQGGGA